MIDKQENKEVKEREVLSEIGDGKEVGKVSKRRGKADWVEICRKYITEDKSEVEIAKELGINERTVVRAINRFVAETDILLEKNKEVLKITLEKVRGIKRRLLEELELLKGEKFAGIRVKYYVELRKNTELEARLLGLLKGEGIISSQNVVIVHNITGDDKEKVIKLNSDRYNKDEDGGGE